MWGRCVRIASRFFVSAALFALTRTRGKGRVPHEAIIGIVRSPELRDLLMPLGAITELGSTWAVSLVAGAALLLGVLLRESRSGLAGALIIVLASIGNSSLKIAIARERPDLLDPVVLERGYSFPSGHSALGMVGYGVLAVIVARSSLPPAIRIGLLVGFAVVVGLIGLSRVWLGAHFPTDVLAGFGPALADSVGPAIDSLIAVAFWVPSRPDSVSQRFVQRFRQVAGRDPAPSEAMLYDAIQALARAAETVGPDPAAIRDYLVALGDQRPAVQGVTGAVRFAGERRENLVMVRVRGGRVYDGSNR